MDMMTTSGKTAKAITNYLSKLSGTDRVKNAADAYAVVPLIYRAIQMRADALASVPVRVYRGRGEVEAEWPFICDPSEFLWKTEAALLARGASFAEVASNGGRIIRDLVWINPYEIEVSYSGGAYTFKQYQKRGAVEWVNEPGQVPQMLYTREFALDDDIQPGVSAAGVSLTATQLLRYMDRFAAYFFEQGAMPVTLLGIDTNDDDEVRRVEGIFRRMLGSIRNAFKIVGVKSKSIDPKPLTPPMKDLVIPELGAEARREVSIAFGIPYSLLDEPANYAVAESHKKTFWQNTVRPRGTKLEGQLNREIFSKMGLRLELAFDELDVFQTDEADRADSLVKLAGVFDTLTAAEILGYDLTEEQIARILDKQAAPVVVPALPAPAPTGGGETAAQPAGGETDGEAAIQADLRRWERKAGKRIKAGHVPACQFESSIIPAALRGAVAGMLEEARNMRDVKRIFDNAAGAALEEAYP